MAANQRKSIVRNDMVFTAWIESLDGAFKRGVAPLQKTLPPSSY